MKFLVTWTRGPLDGPLTATIQAPGLREAVLDTVTCWVEDYGGILDQIEALPTGETWTPDEALPEGVEA